MIGIMARVPGYRAFRWAGWPRKLPMSLTLGVTYRCNSRCKTCNIHQKTASELRADEWDRIFASLGRAPFWVTMSGGEPFLRDDLEEIIGALYRRMSPAIINVPTNGLLTERIVAAIGRLAKECSRSQVIVNVSIDGIGGDHDVIRGVKGSYEKAVATVQALKGIGAPNLSVGIHTVISAFNTDRIGPLYRKMRELAPDSYITEIAEERRELGTMGWNITPTEQAYGEAVHQLIAGMKEDRFGRIGDVTRAFRIEYYRLVMRILAEKRQILPCYAGFASAQIAPDGDVWMCCVKAESVGNLREEEYDFSRIWFSENAGRIRRSIKAGECYCPLANAGYTNMLHNIKSLCRVGWHLFSGR